MGIALSLMMFGMSPAQAAAGSTGTPAVGDARNTTTTASTVARGHLVSNAPTWVSKPSTKMAKTPPSTLAMVDNTSNWTADWKWLRGGWEIRFNWAETRIMGSGLEGCMAVATIVTLGAGTVGAVLAAACAAMWLYAKGVKAVGDCVEVFVPISLVNTQLGTWNCPH